MIITQKKHEKSQSSICLIKDTLKMYSRKLKTAIVRSFLCSGKLLFGSDFVKRIYLTDLNIGVKKNFEKRLNKNY